MRLFALFKYIKDLIKKIIKNNLHILLLGV